MRVRCTSTYFAQQQGDTPSRHSHQHLVSTYVNVGEEYLVLGLTFETDSSRFTTAPYVHLLLKGGGVAFCDLQLFEITDPRASRYWEVRATQFDNQQIVELLPTYLAEILSIADEDERPSWEQEEEYFAALSSPEFRQVCELLQNEYD